MKEEKGFIGQAYSQGYRDGLRDRPHKYSKQKGVVRHRPKKQEWEKVNCRNIKCGWFQKDKNTGKENGHLIGCPYDPNQ